MLIKYEIINHLKHCAKVVYIRSFSGPNGNQNNFEYGHFSRSENQSSLSLSIYLSLSLAVSLSFSLSVSLSLHFKNKVEHNFSRNILRNIQPNARTQKNLEAVLEYSRTSIKKLFVKIVNGF